MMAEHAAAVSLWAADQAPALALRLATRLTIPGEPGVDVAIQLVCETEDPGGLDDTLWQALCRGVHRGIASVEAPLPTGGLAVEITELHLRPAPDATTSGDVLKRIGDTLEGLMAHIMAGLWEGLECVRPEE
ncbi:MAG TPA: hypothetical protein VFW96_13725 [Thermomicrobiales bacterium]|nr:hypothetical protein [Thermomicrobiales bacterium]